MTPGAILTLIEASPVARTLRESPWLFPTIETIHVLALSFVVGSIAMLDLRLLGLAQRDRHVAEVAGEILPWTRSFFLLAALSGGLLFVSRAATYGQNVPFRIKLVLLALAGVNMLAFHATGYRTVTLWGHRVVPPLAVRLAGGVSLAFWVLIVVAGRWIGHTT